MTQNRLSNYGQSSRNPIRPERGGIFAAEPIAAQHHLADERVARKLDINPGSRVIYVRRLVFQPDGPVMYHREYMVYDPRRPTVEAELRITSLEGLFRGQNGQGLRRGDLNLEAVALNDEEADALQMPAGSPALCLEHIFYDFENRPVAWGWFICRADRFRLLGRIGPETSLDAEG